MMVLLTFPVITKYITTAKTAKATNFVSITSIECVSCFLKQIFSIYHNDTCTYHSKYLRIRNNVEIIPPSITGFNMEDENSEKVNVFFL